MPIMLISCKVIFLFKSIFQCFSKNLSTYLAQFFVISQFLRARVVRTRSTLFFDLHDCARLFLFIATQSMFFVGSVFLQGRNRAFVVRVNWYRANGTVKDNNAYFRRFRAKDNWDGTYVWMYSIVNNMWMGVILFISQLTWAGNVDEMKESNCGN